MIATILLLRVYRIGSEPSEGRCEASGDDLENFLATSIRFHAQDLPGVTFQLATSMDPSPAPRFPTKTRWRTEGEERILYSEWLVAGRSATKSSTSPIWMRSVNGSPQCPCMSLRRSTRPLTTLAGTQRFVCQRRWSFRSSSRRGSNSHG
jgi:hypothetical protein